MSAMRDLASFASGPIDIPENMARFVGFSLVDWITVGRAGRDEPVSRAARALADDEGAAHDAALFGGGRASVRTAALVNGTTGHALDYDDTHFGHVGHPSVAVLPAALALAERGGATGAATFDAMAVGLETACRVGAWLGRAHYQAGFHQTGTSGAFGAAAAAGRLLGLDSETMGHAFGLAATRAAGLKSQFGTDGKPLNAGFASDVGVTCALLAAAGAGSAEDSMSGRQGFGATHQGEDNSHALKGLGQDWIFPGVSYKFHACCHGLHAMLEALREMPPVDPDTVRHVVVRTNPRWLQVCDNPAPRTGLQAKFSYRLTAAMALRGLNTAKLESFSAETCARPDLVTVRDRVTVEADETLADTAAHVRVETDRDEREATHDLLQDTDLAEIDARLRGKSRALLGTAEADDLMQAVELLRHAPDAAILAARVEAI